MIQFLKDTYTHFVKTGDMKVSFLGRTLCLGEAEYSSIQEDAEAVLSFRVSVYSALLSANVAKDKIKEMFDHSVAVNVMDRANWTTGITVPEGVTILRSYCP